MNKCFWAHKWPDWVDKFSGTESFGNVPTNAGHPVVIQERRCERCKMLERRIVRV